MITTYATDEATMFAISPGFSTWRTATLTPGMLYVFVNYSQKDGPGWIDQTSILWDSRDVLDFCLRFKNNQNAKILDICLLKPLQRKKFSTGRWEKVLEIHAYADNAVEHPVYITDAGETIGLIPEKAKRKKNLIYKARRIPPKAP